MSTIKSIGLMVKRRRKQLRISLNRLSHLSDLPVDFIRALEQQTLDDVDLGLLQRIAQSLQFSSFFELMLMAGWQNDELISPDALEEETPDSFPETKIDLSSFPPSPRTLEEYRFVRLWYKLKKTEFDWRCKNWARNKEEREQRTRERVASFNRRDVLPV